MNSQDMDLTHNFLFYEEEVCLGTLGPRGLFLDWEWDLWSGSVYKFWMYDILEWRGDIFWQISSLSFVGFNSVLITV